MKYYQNSQKFNELQKSLKISLDDAEKIFILYHEQNKFKSLEPIFYYYSNNFYYFGYKTDPTKDKQDKSFYFLELKINSFTGETKQIDESVDEKEDYKYILKRGK